MKKIFNLIGKINLLVLLVFVTSCTDSDVEPLFDQSINERTAALKSEYSNILTTPENGWVGFYSPNETFGAYTMLMNFDDNGNVDIKSDYNRGNLDNEITYRIDKTLKIELVLESNSVFASIFALNNNNNGGEFVFNIISATADEIILESKLDFGNDITILTLRRALVDDFNLDPIYESAEKLAGLCEDSVYKNIKKEDGERIASFSFNENTRLITLSYFEDDVKITQNIPAIITATGFGLLKPIVINNFEITSFELDDTSGNYIDDVNNLALVKDNLPLKLTDDLLQLSSGGRQAIFANEVRFGVGALRSCAFNKLLEEVDNNLMDLGFTYSGFRLYTDYESTAISDNNVRIRVYARRLSDNILFNGSIYVNVENRDNLVFVTLTGGKTGNGAFFESSFMPLIEFFTNSEGLVFSDEGTFRSNLFNYTNSAGTFTSVGNPSLRTYGLFF